ncbi:hypothetical protein FQA39_LY14244 [Lamprigera yunnana]|nr:hypothetical protein FQA39_LY14244 [Lamprigera yunnana]
MTDKKNLVKLLRENTNEPVYLLTSSAEIVFDFPEDNVANSLIDRHQQILSKHFGQEGGEHVILPPLDDILKLSRRENFSLFIPFHREIAGRLIDIFMGMKNVEELQCMAVYARDRVNPYLFEFCLRVALLHRPDIQNINIQSFIELFPDIFVDNQILSQGREGANTIAIGSRTPIDVPIHSTASNLEQEHRLASFREDISTNLVNAAGEIVNTNLRDDLFFYMHQQIMVRHNLERLSNRFIEWRKAIPESYFPKLSSIIASESNPPRADDQTIRDLNREQDVTRLEQWRDRLFDAIHFGVVKDEAGNSIPLMEYEGIDVHNIGHVFISYIHDPNHRHLESFGAIDDSTTAMKDPIFYRRHAFIDDIFQQFKGPFEQLRYQPVTVTSVTVESKGSPNNVVNTFWQHSDVDLSRGMDFQPRGAIFVRFTYLQHQPFTYKIIVNNADAPRQGSCKIFMAPAQDERGDPWLFQDQRTLFVELDRFVIHLQTGQNTIIRRSDESSVTIPRERTFRDLEGGDELEQFNFCGCGWPHYLLLAKGTPKEMPCHLFVMVSNFEDDRIEQSVNVPCSDASSYCGIKDRLDPNHRSMGYPFDRLPRDGVSTLQQFLTSNMRVQDVSIKFTNRRLRD